MTTYTTDNATADFNGYNTPVYDPPCACDHCPTCGRSDWRRWRWPWNWPQPIWQFSPPHLPTCIGDPPGWLGQGAYFTNVSATA